MRKKKNVTVRIFGSGLEFECHITMELAAQLITLASAASGRRKPAPAPAKA